MEFTTQTKTNCLWKYIPLLFILLFSINVFGQIQIDSAKTTNSTCPNNGSISLYAKTNNPPLLYSIVSGPVVQAAQTNNVFNSLPPGNYSIKISDGAGASKLQSAVITGNYTPLNFTPIQTSPTCKGDHNGKLIGNLTSNTGKGPFTWQLIAPSPATTAPQTSDAFNNLVAGNYTMRVTDACGSYRTTVATVSDPATKFGFYYMPPLIEIVGCDSAWVTSVLLFSPTNVRLPLTYKYQTKNGTLITTIATKIDTSAIRTDGIVRVEQLLKNITYGDNVRVTIFNACGDSVTNLNTIPPFTFYPKYTYSNCGNSVTASYNYVKEASFYYGMKAPVTYTYVNALTNALVDTRTVTGDPNHYYGSMIYGITVQPALTPGNTYKLTIKDGCGKTFQQTYTIPLETVPKIVVKDITAGGCIDSAIGVYRIQVAGFSAGVRIILLSGPATLKSSKPDFAYTDTYTYPKTIPVGYAGQYFFLDNIGVGTYQYKVIDNCGHEVFDSFTISPAQVTSMRKNSYYKKGCLGQNKIYFSIGAHQAEVVVKDIATGNILKTRLLGSNNPIYNIDSVLNVPSGKYEVSFNFEQGGYGEYVNDKIHSCWNLKDTITIEGYQTPEIYTSNSILCHTTITMELIPDSSKGVPPYKYEIISGPQTFSVQNKNTFLVNTPGTYTARIYDICGNASTKQVFVDALSLPSLPPEVDRNCSSIKLSFVPSQYYTYKWSKPNQTLHTGASLSINPITPADTGTYFISRIVSINGCKDTSVATYHLSLANIHEQSQLICQGNTIHVGNHIYSSTGIYTDTLVSVLGCDSIVQLHLTVMNSKRHSISKTICPGQNIHFGGHSYTQSGTYYDTITTVACDSIVTLSLTVVLLPSVSLGKDTSLCQGQSFTINAGNNYAAYFWNNNFSDSIKSDIVVNATGKYWVKVKNAAGCTASDTVEILNIYPLPVATSGSDQHLCSGNDATLTASGGIRYKWFPGGEETATITIHPQVTTIYSVIAYDLHQCGSIPDQVTVNIKPSPVKSPFDKESIVHCFDEGPVTVNSSWGNSFLWSNTGETTQSILVQQAGIYEVKVYDDSGCFINGSVEVKEYCPPQLYVPTAFSPNGDLLNDELEIFGNHFKNFELKIFNRWGEIIFVSTDRNLRWDGMYRGEEMPIGTYPWIISYQGEYEEKTNKNSLKGSITLIR